MMLLPQPQQHQEKQMLPPELVRVTLLHVVRRAPLFYSVRNGAHGGHSCAKCQPKRE